MNIPAIEIVTLENQPILYIRFRGSYTDFRKNARKMFNKLFAYAQENDLIIPDVTKVLTLYNDNPFITKSDQLRTSVALTLPHDAQIAETDDICITSLQGRFAVGKFNLRHQDYGDAWNTMYQEWLFKSSYVPRDAIPFELYVDEPPKNSKDSSQVDIYIPIE